MPTDRDDLPRRPAAARKSRAGRPPGTPEVPARERILRSTEALLRDRGVDGVSMGDVAKHAGIDKSLIFYYFRTKADLIETVLDGYYAAHTGALSAAFQAEGSFSERLHRVIDAYFGFIDAHRLYPRLVQQEVSRSDVDVSKIRGSLAVLCGWTERMLAGIVPPDGPLAARHFFLTLSGIVINYFTYASALDQVWQGDPMSEEARAERRKHVHWVVDAMLEKLAREASPAAHATSPG
jgi:AcrR family transcriptional regulator